MRAKLDVERKSNAAVCLEPYVKILSTTKLCKNTQLPSSGFFSPTSPRSWRHPSPAAKVLKTIWREIVGRAVGSQQYLNRFSFWVCCYCCFRSVKIPSFYLVNKGTCLRISRPPTRRVVNKTPFRKIIAQSLPLVLSTFLSCIRLDVDLPLLMMVKLWRNQYSVSPTTALQNPTPVQSS